MQNNGKINILKIYILKLELNWIKLTDNVKELT